ncbi:MAG: hypothetical protein IJ588_00550 [Prevotella sp.]|nr:hypothetical protein [Prevotella sp.]
MTTLILNSGDTIVMGDSIAVKVVASQSVVSGGTDTTCNDVWIVAVICAALVLITLIAAITVLRWKAAVITAEKSERDDRDRQEKENCERKIEAEKLKRQWELEDKGYIKK